MINFYREERTKTVVRHVVATPVDWVEVQKLLRVAFQDMGVPAGQEPAADAVWYEVDEDELAICYELTSGTTGGWSNRQALQ